MKKQSITIGGNRLGSGEKMKTSLNAYNRSTHNLSTKIATSMGVGTLVPINVFQAMRGDAFDITLNADCRTIPTKGALFGSYKLQVDVFQCPIRLYQAILHNNPLAIGLKMNQVKFPTMSITSNFARTGIAPWQTNSGQQFTDGNMASNSLLKYLGISSLGHINTNPGGYRTRTFNAIPMLAYYDIYKTYYANKQEEKGYIIGSTHEEDVTATISKIWYVQETERYSNTNFNATTDTSFSVLDTEKYSPIINITIYGEDLSIDNVLLDLNGDEASIDTYIENGTITYNYTNNDNTQIDLILYVKNWVEGLSIRITADSGNLNQTMVIKEFDLKNIDDMRYTLLSQHTLGTAYSVNNFDKLPYTEITYQQFGAGAGKGNSLQKFPLAGLALKTYQNDIYNNWLNTDWLEGENSISDLTNVSVSDGKFSMDSLNFAQKLYNMLNRIVLAGNTYEDWQDVVYEEVKRRQIESPIFCGGLSREIMFDEVLQTAPTEDQPLGTIGGRGRFVEDYQKGGKLHIKCDEACYIIIIASLTPRVYYTQGNEFYMTDVFSMDDLHKPAMDGIGFQDLLTERMFGPDTLLNADGTISRTKVGKLPAWIEYMTNVDKAFGDFAEGDRSYMILNRNYTNNDFTTYIDPSKFNYAFADASLTAQNFWMLFNIGVKARRLMSARIIPNV